MLYVANADNTNECATSKRLTMKTSEEVSKSLNQYFSGEKTDIGILKMAFANGHLHFCGSAEITNVLTTLNSIKNKGALKNKEHLSDFIGKVERIK